MKKTKKINNLKSIRKSQGMTQERLAELTGFRVPTISRIENGHRKPNPSTWVAFAQALSVTVDDLKGGM